MSGITQCPQCSTRFRLTIEQLEAHQGMVRCGRCNSIFNANENLYDDEPSPQLCLPIVNDAVSAEDDAEALFNQAFETASVEAAQPDLNFLASAASATGEPHHAPKTLAEQVVFIKDEAAEDSEPQATPRNWPWWLAAVLLLLILLGQLAYFLRVEMTAQLPGLKPALQGYCSLLHCSIELPRKAELMSIESSDLEADAAPSAAITVNILLRNRAGYTQAYPHLELTLTDVEDKPIARRTFTPKEYLKAGEDDQQGLAANRENSIKLHLDTADLKASGYRLFLFYPSANSPR